MSATQRPFYPVPTTVAEILAYVARHTLAAVVGIEPVGGAAHLVDIAVRSEAGSVVQVRASARAARVLRRTEEVPS